VLVEVGEGITVAVFVAIVGAVVVRVDQGRVGTGEVLVVVIEAIAIEVGIAIDGAEAGDIEVASGSVPRRRRCRRRRYRLRKAGAALANGRVHQTTGVCQALAILPAFCQPVSQSLARRSFSTLARR
jgi:hypothetical protein